jgi:HEPN domain-containing protein
MNVVLKEWVEKAEEDFRVASSSARARKYPVHNAVCFHAQQCVEKYLKAILVTNRMDYGKTHDLEVLVTMCLQRYPLWESWRASMKILSAYAVAFRYPGESAGKEEAQEALRIMRLCRTEFRATLGLSRH